MVVTLPVWGSSHKRKHVVCVLSDFFHPASQKPTPPLFSYFTLFLFFVLFFFNEVYLIDNTVFVSDIQQSDPVFFFQIIFQCSLLQDAEYSSLCCAVNPCCWPVSCAVVCIPLPFGDRKFVFYVCKSVSVLYADLLVWLFGFHIDMVSYNICLSLSDLVHWVWYSLGSRNFFSGPLEPGACR